MKTRPDDSPTAQSLSNDPTGRSVAGHPMTRRAMFKKATAAVAVTGAAGLCPQLSSASLSGYGSEPAELPESGQPEQRASEAPVKYCLNMSTVRGQRLSAFQQIELAASAGYDAIAPWIGDIRNYVDNGGTLVELRELLEERKITIESAIGFANWIVDDAGKREEALQQARSDMELIAELGGKRIAVTWCHLCHNTRVVICHTCLI